MNENNSDHFVMSVNYVVINSYVVISMSSVSSCSIW